MNIILISPKYREFNQLLRQNKDLVWHIYRDRSKVTGIISVKVCWKRGTVYSQERIAELELKLVNLCDRVSVIKRKTRFSGFQEVQRYLFYPQTKEVEVFDIFSTTMRSIRLE